MVSLEIARDYFCVTTRLASSAAGGAKQCAQGSSRTASAGAAALGSISKGIGLVLQRLTPGMGLTDPLVLSAASQANPDRVIRTHLQ